MSHGGVSKRPLSSWSRPRPSIAEPEVVRKWDSVDLQRINVKVFVAATEQMLLDPFLEIFAEWREDKSNTAEWIDLADYAHIVKGPGVMLIGHQGNLSTDLGDPGPGLLYANKQGLKGDPEDRLREVLRRALAHFSRLTSDTRYPTDLRPRSGFWEITFNDRLDFPNTDETDQKLEPVVRSLATQLFTPTVTLTRQPDLARRYGLTIHSQTASDLETLAAGLDNPRS